MVRLQKMETDYVRRIQKFYRGHMARVAARRYVKLLTHPANTSCQYTPYQYMQHTLPSHPTPLPLNPPHLLCHRPMPRVQMRPEIPITHPIVTLVIRPRNSLYQPTLLTHLTILCLKICTDGA